MHRKVLFGDELHKLAKDTMQIMAKAVKATLGPSGKLALIDRGSKDAGVMSLITKDGVTVAKNILPFEDPCMTEIGEKVKEISANTNTQCGDGTTTAIVLSESLYNESIKKIRLDNDPVLIKESIERYLPIIVKKLEDMAIPIESDIDIENVASISANNDRAIGKLVADAINRVGEDGHITLTEGDSLESTVNIVEGIEYPKGVSNASFMRDKNSIDYENPLIFVFDGKLEDFTPLYNIYENIAKGRPLIVIGEIGQNPMKFLVVNNRQGIDMCHINPYMVKETRRKMLKDLAISVGAELIHVNQQNAAILTEDDLGSADKISISMNKTTIINGNSNIEQITERIDELKKDLDAAKSLYDKDILKERIGRLSSGVGIIYVGGKTEDEIKEKKDRVEDSLNATRAALQSGVVPGGGYALYKIAQELEDDDIGSMILKEALQSPIKQIITNTGLNCDKILNSKEILSENKGFNAKTKQFEDLIETGVIDPVKVTISALKNAVSIVDLLINLEVMTVIIKDKSLLPGMN